jgi:hypothetical protein
VLDRVRVSRFGVVGNFNELLQGIEVRGGGLEVGGGAVRKKPMKTCVGGGLRRGRKHRALEEEEADA